MTELERLHEKHLVIMDEVIRLCVEHDIDYFIIAGSLLGAVRHKGFIPWDDDLDIGMLRSDYDKFIEVAQTKMNDKFSLITLENNKDYGLPFIKVMLNDTIVEEANLPKNIKNYGIFVDIFPFDNVPSVKSKEIKHQRNTKVLKSLLLAKNGYNIDTSFFKKLIYSVLRIITLLIPRNRIISRMESEMIKYNHEQNPMRYVNIGGSYGYQKETINANWAKNLSDYSFEGRKVKSFEDYDAYLNHMYGDYMKLPPKEQQSPRHSYKSIKF